MSRNDEFIRATLSGADAVWNRLRYDCDGIIEASAGTGKTFTLERIVLKLVTDNEHPVEMKNILLVTFTEKAAGELKDRIRTILEEAGCLPPDFDEATICTIHSFCRELLTTYAFENRVPMQMEIGGSNDDLVHRAVRAALLGDEFRKKYGRAFAAYMVAGGFDTADVLVAKAEARLAECANRNAPPAVPADVAESDKDLLRESIAKLCPNGEYGRLDEVLGWNALPLHRTDGRSFPTDFHDFQALLPDLESGDDGAFVRAVTGCRAILGRGPNRLNPRISQPYRCRLFEHAPLFGDIIGQIERMGETFSAKLVADLAVLAWPEYLRRKAESAMLTFDDLVTQASLVIAKEAEIEGTGERSALLDAVRRRYRIALVDEFQDTDAKQWNIFRSIFSSVVNRVEGDGVPAPKQGFLLVVGDPKQAIYGWRGADVGTYLAAKDSITTRDDSQPPLWLGKTYRSSRELVDAFNSLFSGGEPSWFAGMEENGRSIEYASVDYPEGNARFRGLTDYTGREAVTLLECLPHRLPDPSSPRSGYGNTPKCLSVFMENAAREMKRLRALSPAYTMTDKEGKEAPRKLEYRDMCVLVRGHAGAQAVQRVLARHDIPFAYYKEAGLFATEEAEALLAVFDFLSAPGLSGNLAALLLTPLFKVHPAELGKTLSEGENKFAKLLVKWQEHAAKRDWTSLFESILNETALARPDPRDYGYDRRWTAFRQMLDKLLVAKGRSALVVEEFAKLLRAWCKDDRSAGENGALRQKESEGDRVQIMTMHASKGLEFKAVFIAAGWGGLKEDANSEKRLYYVALTRAEQKLYLPWTRWSPHRRDGSDEHGIGSVGSALLADGFLAKGIQALFGGNAAEKAVYLGEESEASVEPGESEAPAALPKTYLLPYLKHRKVQWDSFTSLNDHGTSKRMETTDAKSSDERQGGAWERARSLLPPNNVSGTAFHEIMEELCGNDDARGDVGFGIGKRALDDALRDEAFAAIVHSAMRRNAIANQEQRNDSTAKTLMRMVWNALNREIRFEDGTTFFLRNIPHADRRAEVEFVLDEGKAFESDLPALDGRKREGRFNGSIDLLVRPKGAGSPLYILDWKTNSLSDFGEKAVEAEMEESGYDLQYKLYSVAVQSWLGEGAVAGVAYLFVRGGEGVENRCGVFARTMDAALRDDCRASVRGTLLES